MKSKEISNDPLNRIWKFFTSVKLTIVLLLTLATTSIIGTLILGILRNGLNLIGVTPYWQRVFIGALIIVTVVIDRVQHRKEM